MHNYAPVSSLVLSIYVSFTRVIDKNLEIGIGA